MQRIFWILPEGVKRNLSTLMWSVVHSTAHITATVQPLFLTQEAKKYLRERFVILDDLFPHILSGFRIAEYNAYMEHFNTHVYSTALSFRAINEKRGFSKIVREYEHYYPQFRNRVSTFFRLENNFSSKLIYTIFLQNADRFINIAEIHNTPFVFTLYPGGGLFLNDNAVDKMLRRVCLSPSFRKVIVTQRITQEYLLGKEFCPPEQIEFIYGGVLPSDRLVKKFGEKKYYQMNKSSFDICFVANKYMKDGADKGYDVFLKVAKKLSKAHRDIFFHVVGPYDENDIDVSDIMDRVKFYGMRHTDFFAEFYAGMDIILSPNAPFILRPGAFDGFPTGSCVEAGLCGVAVFCTDILDLNVAFKNNEEIVIIPREVDEICAIVDKYYDDYNRLYELAKQGQTTISRVFDFETQMRPRLRILSEYMTK